MPIWPFRRKTSDAPKDAALRRANPKIPRTTTSASTATPALSGQRRSRRRNSQRQRRASPEQKNNAQHVETQRKKRDAEKEGVPRPENSIEDITALPVSRELKNSPHLRPVSVDRPYIPYNFQHSASRTSVQRSDAQASRPQTLRSKRSAIESTPQRKQSSKKRKDNHTREEEIRSMTAPIPVPKRPGGFGEGPLLRDSKKVRSVSGRGHSNVSLPAEGSVHSSMSGIMDQRGWEVSGFDVFSPRPTVRVSGLPQHASPGSLPTTSGMSRSGSRKGKVPVFNTGSSRQYRRIGELADDYDISDLRVIMERDAKRRDKNRMQQQEKLQEKLERKLRRRLEKQHKDVGRATEDVEKNAPDELERRALEDSRQAEVQRLEGERRARQLMTLHPALRAPSPEREAGSVGLGIGEHPLEPVAMGPEHAHDHAMPTFEETGTQNTGTYLNYPAQENIPQNPFADPVPDPFAEAEADSAYTPVEKQIEDPVIGTALTGQAMRAPYTNTPPLSPILSNRAASSLSGTRDLRMEQRRDAAGPAYVTAERKSSEASGRRPGAWATFFRRGGTSLNRPLEDQGRAAPFESSFSNTSRESMSRGPLPAHLVGPQQPSPRDRSATPTRTTSRFREDLPELPISPPDSRVQLPDVTTAAAAVAAARRGKRSATPVDILGSALVTRDSFPDPATEGRTDSPVSPSGGGSRLMSTSLASIGSEGSWLSGSRKQRGSHQSGLSRGIGSISRQQGGDFSASYEELPGSMSDEEYFKRMTRTPESRSALRERKTSSPAFAGASPGDESEYGEAAGPPETAATPFTVHDSVRRQPTLVHRNPRVKSREGLLADYEEAPASEGSSDQEDHETGRGRESPEPAVVQSARSVSVGYGIGIGHARAMSAGSAKLLDMPPSKRPSMDFKRDSYAHSPTGGPRAQL